ncbi:MAG: 4Fe-4S binding protein [Sedimentisphaerales bacterium]|nr:4Fe-4S binding protein [Sedimentisphaerales bacterium]
MRLLRSLLILSYGFFTIGAQTVLFREFVTAFEGNDISVGIFFGSWFLWVGLAAILVRRSGRLADGLARYTRLLFLAYVPALAVQLILIARVRELAGVASYDLMSIQAIVLWAVVVNAPVSLVTGVLFPVACRWVEKTEAFPVSRVYILEATGSLLGGLVVTLLLSQHVPAVRVLFLLALLLSLSVAAVAVAGLFGTAVKGRRRAAAAVVSLALALLAGGSLLAGFDRVAAGRLRLLKWASLLPPDALEGAFHTAQAEYFYGTYRGQWVVVREGSVCEAMPDEEAAGQTAAIGLCQNPQTKRILVIGSGLALCDRFLALPQVEHLAWTHADGEYIERIGAHLPDEYRIADDRFHPVTREIRQYLRGRADSFDLAVLNLPDVTSSAFNRYYTREFYEQVRASLRPGGVLSVSIAGGENVMGPELLRLGASVKRTLELVFANLVLVPGDRSWFLASDTPNLTGDPATLRDRFATIEAAESIFPSTGLLSVYLPDRAARALELYDKVDLPDALLVNRDARPLTHLYSLLLAARQSGASVTRFVRLLTLAGLWPFLVPVLVFVALRLFSSGAKRTGPGRSSFDSCFLVFSAGGAGIGVMIVLMYLYQTRFGSLYLHVGLISALFMAGLTAGAVLAAALNSATSRLARATLPGVLAAHAGLLVLVALGGSQMLRGAGHGLFAAAFAAAGLCCGLYWPIAARQLGRAGFEAAQAGSRLETADHLGACVGGLVVSLLMIPVLGTGATLLVLAGVLLANMPAAVVTPGKRESAAAPVGSEGLKRAGYALFGAGACVVICSNLLTAAAERLQPALPPYAVEALAGERPRQEAAVTLDGGRRMRYYTVAEPNEPSAGYIFASRDLAPGVRGFGGRIDLAVRTDASGKLLDFLIVRSNETPSYLELLGGWLDSLKGRDLFVAEPFAGIEAVTGATVSSEAVLAALRESSRRFAARVLGRSVASDEASAQRRATRRWLPSGLDAAGLYLMGAFAAAVVVTRWGGFRARLAVLAATFVAGGALLNAQYSSEQIATLLSLQTPALQLTGTLLLTVGVPVLVLLFGNLYCGYVCPFGAGQELLSYVVPRRLKTVPARDDMRAGRFVKYVVLFVLIAAFFLSRNRTTLAGDPLISVFNFRPSVAGLREGVAAWSDWMLVVLTIAVVGALFFIRFWCRYLCPVGAFLSLLNHARLLRRWMPRQRFGRCEFGLTAGDHLDCIYCDRCRYRSRGAVPVSAKEARTPHLPVLTRPFVVTVVVFGLFVGGVSLSRFRRVMPVVIEDTPAATGAAGQSRDVDVQRMRALIEQGRLSDKEALYYRPVGTQTEEAGKVSGESN